jgi:tetratricopeptide (TPR) repeat protein
VVGTLGKRGNVLRDGRGRCLALVGLLTLVLGASSLPAHAAATELVAPDAHGVIHTCIGGDDGDELHVVNAGEPCPDHEQALGWNWRGRPGKRGSPGPASESFASLLLELLLVDESLTAHSEESHEKTESKVKKAASNAGDWFELLGLGILALALALSLARWATGLPWRCGPFRRSRWTRSLGKLLGPTLQIEAFEDGAMDKPVGPSFALLSQARIGGGRETGSHLYLVTGEERTSDYIAALQGVPQTQLLAAALTLVRLAWRRPRLTVSGSLKPIDDDQTAAATVSLRLDAHLIDTSEFWLAEPPTPKLTPAASNRVLAVAVAGWIEHEAIDETPGPPAREVLLSCDSRSWALFRAGSELNRMSLLDEAADLYERALAIDHDNVGALIDLAHLRRLDGHFAGAIILARDALGLIVRRNDAYGRRNDEDPSWYRAQIVLATTYAEWVRSPSPERKPPDDAATQSLRFALEAASVAMAAKDRLEELVAPQTLRDAAGRGKIGVCAYVVALCRARRMPLRRWRTFRRRSVELHALLETTFEPGALLLIAADPTANPTTPLSSKLSEDAPRDESPNDKRERLREGRKSVKDELARGDRRPAVLIEYVKGIPLKSPRVVYNLACWFGREAARAKAGEDAADLAAAAYCDKAFELLRQSISRTPPLERRALLCHAELDSDLACVRRKHGPEIAGLWRLVPTDEARFRSLDRFMQEADAWANRDRQVTALAVVGTSAQGAGDAGDTVSVVVIADAPERLAASDDWLGAFERPALIRRWRTRSLYRPRIELPSGLIVEFLVLTRDGVRTDPSVRKLARDGYSVLYDETKEGEDESLGKLLEQTARVT